MLISNLKLFFSNYSCFWFGVGCLKRSGIGTSFFFVRMESLIIVNRKYFWTFFVPTKRRTVVLKISKYYKKK